MKTKEIEFNGFLVKPYLNQKEWFAQDIFSDMFLYKNKLVKKPHTYKGLGRCISAIEKFVTKK